MARTDYAELNNGNAPQVAGADGVIGYHDLPEALAGQQEYPLTELDKSDPPPPPPIAPRRFGMKIGTFWLLVGIVTFLIIGGAVGGAVGGTISHAKAHIDAVQGQGGSADGTSPSSSSSSTPSASSGSSSTTSADAPITSATNGVIPSSIIPTTDCPTSNTTMYTSKYVQGMVGKPPANAALTFQKFCELSFPAGLITIAEAYVYTFDACIEMCASMNFYAGDATCAGASYWQGGKSPGNCWVYSRTAAAASSAPALTDLLIYTKNPNNNIAVTLT